MNFDFTDDQQAIKATARELLTKRITAERVRQLAEAREYDDAVWAEMCGLGWPGIFISEDHGGQGLGQLELVILLEELGYALAPSPFLSNAAAGLLIQHAGSDEQRGRWLPGIASGEARGTVGLVSDGSAPLVPDADTASVVVLVEGDSATVIEGPAGEVVEAIDPTRRFSTVTRADGEALEGDVDGGLDRIEGALAAELVGVAQRTMEMAVDYARDRKQFDTPIGAFQAVSHRCAQMLLEVEGARSLAYYAGWAADAEPETVALAASMAKAYAADAAWRVTASSLQVHGGIGFTWEHDLHFFLKRAKTDGHLFGSPRRHRDRVAELSGAVPAAA
jgi:alkylation response protein AidB-like acyl-CoA dehydrogenase